MDASLQRRIDRWVGVPACAALTAWHSAASVVSRPASAPPRRALVILLSEMGSLVLAEPLFRRLAERAPGCEIHLMCFARNQELARMLRLVPDDRIIPIRDSSLGSLAVDLTRAIDRMRALRLDAVIDCELFARVSAVLSGLSGARMRAGFDPHTQEGLYRGSFLTHPVLYNPYRHLSHQLVGLVDALFSNSTPSGKDAPPVPVSFTPPSWQPDAGEVERETAQLERDHPVVAGKRLVLLYPSGGLLPIRAWPAEHYAALARGLLEDGCAVGIIGMPEDRELAKDIWAMAGGHEACVSLAGYTRSVRHLMALFHRASLLVTNDGGPGQFAAATPMPSIVLFGPETPVLYGSWSPRAQSCFAGIACSPCLTAYNHRNSPCDGDNQCLKRILPEEVLARARAVLAGPAA